MILIQFTLIEFTLIEFLLIEFLLIEFLLIEFLLIEFYMIKSFNNINLHPLVYPHEGRKILDYRNRTRLDENKIPQLFIKNIVFQSYNSFQQNHRILGSYIRKFVKLSINSNTINAIGGESYLYTSNINCKFYTNSLDIFKDSLYNNYTNSHIIDYNNDNIVLNSVDTVINLSRLNLNLMKQINMSSSNKLIIINCHHKDFWKKIKNLSNFKLITRKKFIDYKIKYFITVNIFTRKSFISLGGNCSVTYQLNKLNLRNLAYPFDWSQIKLTQIIKAFNTNFEEYDKIKLIKYSENHNSYVLHNKYCKFAHEVLKKKDLNDFSNQIKRRIKRLKCVNPIFVRIETYRYIK